MRRNVIITVLVIILATAGIFGYRAYKDAATDSPPQRGGGDIRGVIDRMYPGMAGKGRVYTVENMKRIENKWYLVTIKSTANGDISRTIIYDGHNGASKMEVVVRLSTRHTIEDFPIGDSKVSARAVDELRQEENNEQ